MVCRGVPCSSLAKTGNGHKAGKVGGGAVGSNGDERLDFGHSPKSRLLRTDGAGHRDFLRTGIERINKGR